MPDELAALQDRLLLKAEAASWASERGRRIAARADFRLEVLPEDKSFFSKAKTANCYLWMLNSRGQRPKTPYQFDLISAWYENVAEAIALAARVMGSKNSEPSDIEDALGLVAESQSALRLAIADCGGYSDDDQRFVLAWLTQVAGERRIPLRHGIKHEDATDTFEWAAVAGRIHAHFTDWGKKQERLRTRTKLLGTLRHKVGVLSSGVEPAAEVWTEMMEVVQDLVEAGLLPNNVEVRDLLLPLADAIPPLVDVPGGFKRVVQEIERYRKARAARRPSSEAAPKHTGVIRQIKRLVAGKAAVLIGGHERTEAKEALERSLGLSELVWISTRKHESYKNFEAVIARPEVAVVFLAIRWSSHSFGEVSKLCERHGKPLVRLPGGYSPNRVAEALLDQASHRLAGNAT